MIEIIGTELNQWDTGRSVSVTGIDASHVHFANQGDSKAVIMELANSQALIPDYLFQTGKQLCVYAVANGATIERKMFSVQKRERPENYIYKDDERNYIYELISNAEEAAEDANLAAENANNAAASANQAAKNANEAANEAANLAKEPPAKLTEVTLRASAWTGTDSLYSQVVTIDGVTEYSKVDLLPSVEQLAIFHNKNVTFVTENEDGVVTVFAIGDKPTNDYTMQVSITEVAV